MEITPQSERGVVGWDEEGVLINSDYF